LIERYEFRTIIARSLLLFSAALIAWGGIVGIHLIERAPGERSLRLHGIYDEVGHLLTALMIAIGLRAVRFPIPIWPVLLGGVILDVGHIFDRLGITEPIAGSTRNGSHAILSVVLIALIGFADRRHANVWLGISLGALSHLWRDMGTGSLALLWPIKDEVDATTFTRYMAGLLGASVAMIGSGALLDLYEGANGADQGHTRKPNE
jgi:hypothetical protein